MPLAWPEEETFASGNDGTGQMKKGGILNPSICSLIAELGQGDELLIVDAAFALPPDAYVIDLSLVPGIPRFMDVLKAVAHELVIDSAIIAREMADDNPEIYREVTRLLDESSIDEISHHEFQEQAADAKGVIRTAEFSPYANIKLICGSAF